VRTANISAVKLQCCSQIYVVDLRLFQYLFCGILKHFKSLKVTEPNEDAFASREISTANSSSVFLVLTIGLRLQI